MNNLFYKFFKVRIQSIIFVSKRISFIFYILIIFYNKNILFSLPETLYLPIIPNYSKSLISQSNNTIQINSKINIYSDDYGNNFFYYILNFKFNVNKTIFSYYLTFNVMTNGDMYLVNIGDSTKQRDIYDELLVFPEKINFSTNYKIGENIYFKFIKYFPTFIINEKPYKNVIMASLVFLDITNHIYFEKENGIIQIITPYEIFK